MCVLDVVALVKNCFLGEKFRMRCGVRVAGDEMPNGDGEWGNQRREKEKL